MTDLDLLPLRPKAAYSTAVDRARPTLTFSIPLVLGMRIPIESSGLLCCTMTELPRAKKNHLLIAKKTCLLCKPHDVDEQ